MGKSELDVRAIFPEVGLINDEALQEKVVTVWQKLWQESEWEKLEDMPTSLDIPAKHVPHNRAVLAMAMAIADAFREFHNVDVDQDVLIAGGLLQDACKVIETRPVSDGVAHTERGAMFPHAFLGAQIAMELGVEDVICDIILNHTPQSAHFPNSIEGRILFFADQVDLLAIRSTGWKKVLMLKR